MNILIWLVVGGVIGWIASLIVGTDAQQGVLLNVIVGIVGALIGGWLISPMVGVGTINQGAFNLPALGRIAGRRRAAAGDRQPDSSRDGARLRRDRRVPAGVTCAAGRGAQFPAPAALLSERADCRRAGRSPSPDLRDVLAAASSARRPASMSAAIVTAVDDRGDVGPLALQRAHGRRRSIRRASSRSSTTTCASRQRPRARRSPARSAVSPRDLHVGLAGDECADRRTQVRVVFGNEHAQACRIVVHRTILARCARNVGRFPQCSETRLESTLPEGWPMLASSRCDATLRPLEQLHRSTMGHNRDANTATPALKDELPQTPPAETPERPPPAPGSRRAAGPGAAAGRHSGTGQIAHRASQRRFTREPPPTATTRKEHRP